MYFFGLSKEEVLLQKHVVSYKETSKQNQITLFGRQVYQMKSESYMSEKTELEASVTVRIPETKPSFLSDRISSNILKVMDQSSDKTTNKEAPSLLDLNSTPVDDSVSEPRYCFLQDLNCPYVEEKETSCDKSGIGSGPSSPQCQNVHEKDSTASPASYTSCCTTENNLRIESGEPSCRTRLEFRGNEEEDSYEVIQMAAESLVHISEISYQKPVPRTNSSHQDHDFPDKPETGKAEPECSCDSYELHTLGITETNTGEEFSMSLMALDKLNNITRNNNKEIGVKIRRGRRMKNFQKEILPNLTSLSRHEIREDINILEAVLRSKEYKKMQGKTKDVRFGENSRNKRSGPQRCVGKRRQKA